MLPLASSMYVILNESAPSAWLGASAAAINIQETHLGTVALLPITLTPQNPLL
jgi:hypothetical protein